MLVVSNHCYDSIGSPADAVIRCNLAWSKDRDDAERTVSQLRGHKIFLDFPQGRTKPPKPVVTLDEAIALANKYEVDFFAVSNVESPYSLLGIRSLLKESIEICPKIETKRGVAAMSQIIKKVGVKYIMLDKDDLFVDVGHDNKAFEAWVQQARNHAAFEKVYLLELTGVVFSV